MAQSELFDLNIKKLGFGMMRLPKIDGSFDDAQINAMVDRFMAAGFNYFDTAFVYEGSEEATKRALVSRYPRESYFLANKMAPWSSPKTKEATLEQIKTSLARTGAGYFDFYLLHSVEDDVLDLYDDFDLWNAVRELKAQGLIRHYGFSFHGTPAVLEQILSAHPDLEFVQLQINYADWENDQIQSRACYEIARRHDTPIVIMEPVKGGNLATPPQGVIDVFQKADPQATPAAWALRYAASLDGVLTVLSGMSTLEQMDENLAIFRDLRPLSAAERAVIADAQAELAKIPLIGCTSCNYCGRQCPEHIAISGTFAATNFRRLYGEQSGKTRYQWLLGRKNHWYCCVGCGACETVCPQHLPIRELLKSCGKELGIEKE